MDRKRSKTIDSCFYGFNDRWIVSGWLVRGEEDRAERTEPLLVTQAIRVLPKADFRGPPKGFLVRVRELQDLDTHIHSLLKLRK